MQEIMELKKSVGRYIVHLDSDDYMRIESLIFVKKLFLST